MARRQSNAMATTDIRKSRRRFGLKVAAAPIRQQVVEKLRTAILECRFEPGGRLVERDLCELTGVSRGSVREALRQLESEGLVKTVPFVGPVVASLTAAETREIFEVRAALEGLVGELFAQHATDVEIRGLEAALTQMSDACRRNDEVQLHKSNTRFYNILGRGCRNTFLKSQIDILRGRVSAWRQLVMADSNRNRERLIQLSLFLSAAKNRDPVAAHQACVDHIKSSERLIIETLAARKPGSLLSGLYASAKPRRVSKLKLKKADLK